MLLTTSVLTAALALSQAAQPQEFVIAGAHIGQSYDAARRLSPTIRCEVSCVDPKARFFGQPGNLWFGVGDGAINQLAFRFVPILGQPQAQYVREQFIALYGHPSKKSDGCDVWEKTKGKIVLCVSDGMSLAYWHDQNWGRTISRIP